jgi:hypothetical protein
MEEHYLLGVTQYSLVEVLQCFGETYCLHIHSGREAKRVASKKKHQTTWHYVTEDGTLCNIHVPGLKRSHVCITALCHISYTDSLHRICVVCAYSGKKVSYSVWNGMLICLIRKPWETTSHCGSGGWSLSGFICSLWESTWDYHPSTTYKMDV